MKRTCKKAFTIVELVIVIAVIAVLAAVLIPTFVSLVDRANQSSDISAVRNMNTALLNDEAVDGKPQTLTDALLVLEEAGMDANQYKALAKDRKLVWDQELNRVLYVTSDNKVLFPEEYVDRVYKFGETPWVTLTGQMPGDNSWLSSSDPVTNYIVNETSISGSYTKYTLKSNAQLVSWAEYMRSDDKKGAGMIIELEQDAQIDLLGAEWLSIGEFKGVFNGNGATISNLTMTDRTQDAPSEFTSTTNNSYRPYGFISSFSGAYFGNVTFDRVNVNAPGKIDSANHTVAVAIGAALAPEINDNVVIDNITVNGTVTGAYRVAGIVGFAGGTSTDKMKGSITISNCENNAAITSTLCASTYNTAAGILSANNQMESTATLTITGNTNNGAISGQISGGIVGATFGAEGGNGEKQQGEILIHGNTNTGAIKAHHIDGYKGGTYSGPNGEYIYKVEVDARAAGIISAQTKQKGVYVYSNTNSGTVTATNETAGGKALAVQIGFDLETDGLGYQIGKTPNGEQENTGTGTVSPAA